MKGTASHGRKNRLGSHIMCRRCGRRSYHKSKEECSSCGFGKSARKRSYNWQAY